jgi:hypothetical protein
LELGLVLSLESAPRADPEQGREGVAWSELRVGVLSERPVEAHEAAPFFENAAEPQDWAQGRSPRAEKQILRVKRGGAEAQVRLEL